MKQEALLKVENLHTHFYTRAGIVRAVNGVSFSLPQGKTLGIVGESGSGKSVTMMSIMGLIPSPPGRIVAGKAWFQGQDLLSLSERQLRQIRGKDIAMIFQDPMTSLNPYLKISTQLMEVLWEHEQISRDEALQRALEALAAVGIPDPERRIHQYPHEFSGGMRQRVMIAMAIITRPKLLIADEPTTALDVTVQAQILELLKQLQHEYGMGLIVITHDLGVVAGISDEVVVMYAGQLVERGSSDDIFYHYQHPYTYSLLRAIPKVTTDSDEQLYAIPGLPPDPAHLPPGCPFSPRCPFVKEECQKGDTSDIPVRHFSPNHEALCYLEGLSL